VDQTQKADKPDKVVTPWKPKMVTPEELMVYLTVSRVWVYKAVRERRIPFYHIGRHIRFDPDEITSWLAERKNQGLKMPRRIPAKGKRKRPELPLTQEMAQAV
jgi:excisionase family DNA binding protein